MSRLRILLMGLGAMVLLGGCEQLFSTNAFSGLHRDPSKLSYDEQIAYGESALSSGDADVMADAYDALSESLEKEDNSDPELNGLAVELAIGGSGLKDIFPDLLEAAVDGAFSNEQDLADAIDDELDEVDYDYINEAVDQVDLIKANGGEVKKEQYVLVAVGLLMREAEAAGGVENLDPTDADVEEAEDFVNDAINDLDSRGETSDILDDLQDLYSGLP
ncbi:MAG: hypothetical protein ACLFUM_03325 [Spirochaetaceae bacterium]